MPLDFKLTTYLATSRIGHMRYSVYSESNGWRISSTTVNKVKAFSSEITQSLSSETIIDSENKPLKEDFYMISGGAFTHIEATFTADTISCRISTNNTIIQKDIAIPSGITLTGDTTFSLRDIKKNCIQYTFNPVSASIEETKIILCGEDTVSIGDKIFECRKVQTKSISGDADIWIDSAGKIIKCTTTAEITMLNEPLEHTDFESVNLPFAMRIRPDKYIRAGIRYLKLKINDRAFEINTNRYDICAEETDKYLKPSIYITSSDEDIAKWVRSIAGEETDKYQICSKIREAIYDIMTYASQMGVVRPATDIFASKCGVCRDYSILFAACCRSIGIPCRIAAGLVYNDDAFYYHAWVECFVKDKWIPFDATLSADFVDATHIKLAEGSEDALLSMNNIIGSLSIEIIDFY